MSLIPGLPNDLICLEVLARLPWYARPVMATASSSLKQAIEGIDPKLTMKVDLEGQAVILTKDGSILLKVPECSTSWRRLPKVPLPGSSPDSSWATVTDGMVVVWTYVNQVSRFYRLDLSKPLVNWDPIVDCPILDTVTFGRGMIFRGHLYYDQLGPEPVLWQYSFRTGQALEHRMPEGVSKLWCAGDDRHLHAFVPATETVLEFDTTTFQWKTMSEAFSGRSPFVCTTMYPVSRLTSTILFDPMARRWVRVTIDHPPSDKGATGMLVASLWGSVYAICDSSCASLWKCRIDFTKEKNTSWKLIYKHTEDEDFSKYAHNLLLALDIVYWMP